jgi:hypothetical protein
MSAFRPRTLVTMPGCFCVQGFAASPRYPTGSDTQWLVATLEEPHKRTSSVHFTIESSSQVDARRQAASKQRAVEIDAILGFVRFIGGTCAPLPRAFAVAAESWLRCVRVGRRHDRGTGSGPHGYVIALCFEAV